AHHGLALEHPIEDLAIGVKAVGPLEEGYELRDHVPLGPGHELDLDGFGIEELRKDHSEGEGPGHGGSARDPPGSDPPPVSGTSGHDSTGLGLDVNSSRPPESTARGPARARANSISYYMARG